MSPKRTLIIGAAAAYAIWQLAAPRANAYPDVQPHRASEPYGCVVWEDDSFACGHVIPDPSNPAYLQIDREYRFVTGCIPGGYCDDPEVDESCPES